VKHPTYLVAIPYPVAKSASKVGRAALVFTNRRVCALRETT
jgi:hypothetical protein